MNDIILLKLGEIILKGLNRRSFEQKLINNVRRRLAPIGNFKVYCMQSTIYVEAEQEGADMDAAFEALKKVFGIINLSRAAACEKDKDAIVKLAIEYLKDEMESIKSFKVESKRSDKRFPMNSEQINRELGHELLLAFPQLSVDVHDPEIKVCTEIREKAYLYSDEIMGAGGMPTGTAGRAALLISGGIDSPVAGYLMARRGLELSAVHFFSYPYTSERAKDKVIELARLVSRYSGPVRLHLVPFTDIQLAIYEQCPPKETTVLMRRLMMRIAEMWAREDGALALITGEALGQVASQTLESLCVTDDAVSMPVFRPLIGFDKDDIVAIAKKIDTFQTSILPYEDCCTVFVPQHPVTKPKVEDLRKSEAMVDFTDMIAKAMENTETLVVSQTGAVPRQG